jgi:hypothetical protein
VIAFGEMVDIQDNPEFIVFVPTRLPFELAQSMNRVLMVFTWMRGQDSDFYTAVRKQFEVLPWRVCVIASDDKLARVPEWLIPPWERFPLSDHERPSGSD